jgi:ABC-2 type transport system ATP-binding protein
MEAAVTISKLHVTLGGKVKAIQGIDLELPAGKMVGIIGPSGAGKTTLSRSIVGRVKLTEGSIEVFGAPTGSADLRHHVSYMPQGLSVYPDLTVAENMAYFAKMFGIKRKDVKSVVTDVLKTVELSDKAGALVADLSGGQKQRVSLAAALIGSPRLMVLDEPTVGLDPVLRDRLWKLFASLASKGTSLIITSHSMDEAERCDDLVLVRNGKVIAHASPAELKKQTGTKTVEESFLKLAGGTE